MGAIIKILVIFIILFPTMVNASVINQEPWSTATYVTFGASLIAGSIDCIQTLQIVKHPDEFYEVNNLIGEHPNRTDVIKCFVGAKLIMYGVSFLLPDKWRIAMFGVTTGASAVNVWRNHHVGIEIKF